MLDELIDQCKTRIAEEEKLAFKARSPDVAIAHSQAAMIARTKLASLQRQRSSQLADTPTGLFLPNMAMARSTS